MIRIFALLVVAVAVACIDTDAPRPVRACVVGVIDRGFDLRTGPSAAYLAERAADAKLDWCKP